MSYRAWIRDRGGAYLALLFRAYIGGVFVYASLPKIAHAADFAEAVAAYQLAPFWAVNGLALVIPWTELFCGLLLVAGVRTRSAATIAAGMLCLFTVAIAVNLVRGAPISCGCFGATGDPVSWLTVARDLLWLSMTVYVCLVDSALQLERSWAALPRRPLRTGQPSP